MNMQSLKDYAEINSTTTSTPLTTDNTTLLSAVRALAKSQVHAEKNQERTN